MASSVVNRWGDCNKSGHQGPFFGSLAAKESFSLSTGRENCGTWQKVVDAGECTLAR